MRSPNDPILYNFEPSCLLDMKFPGRIKLYYKWRAMSKYDNMRMDHGYCNTECFVVLSKITFVTEVELSANIRWFFDYEGFCLLSLTRDF